MAHRGVRRKQNLALKTSIDYENLLLPHRLESVAISTAPRQHRQTRDPIPQLKKTLPESDSGRASLYPL